MSKVASTGGGAEGEQQADRQSEERPLPQGITLVHAIVLRGED